MARFTHLSKSKLKREQRDAYELEWPCCVGYEQEPDDTDELLDRIEEVLDE